jgi:hypothetical protein
MKPHTVRNAHVRPGLPRARQAEGELMVTLRFGEAADRLADQAEAEAAWQQAVTAELVACTLGQRERYELRTDLAGKLGHALITLRRSLFKLAAPR